ncbi:MAG: hypothetical protein M3N56_16115, partial [Actinomycetota bacterium]|nr:hypothetical protein [Actinomycetota bacterium]
PSTVAIIMVPRAARAQAAQGNSSRVLKLSGLAVAATALICTLPAILAPGLVIEVMFGPGYEAAEPGVLPAVLAGTGLAMLNLLCIYTVAIRDRRWLWLLVGGVALQVVAIAVFHASPQQIAWAQVSVATAVLIANELMFHSLIPRPRRRTP